MKNTVANKHFPYRERNVLILDIEKDEYSVLTLEKEFCHNVLGGRSLAFDLWDRFANYDKLDNRFFHSGSPVVIALGAASDLVLPYCISSCLVTYNLESNSLVSYNFSSHNFVASMASLGYCAIVIKGRARRLTNIQIYKDEIKFYVDETLHLLTTREVSLKLSDATSLISIGPSGENCSVYSSVVVDNKIVGRSGVGSTFGIKNIKVISFYTEESCRTGYFKDLSEEFADYILPKKLGKESLVPYANKYGWAAIEGFKYRFDPRLWGLGGTDLTPLCETDWLYALSLGANLGFYSYDSVDILEQCCLELGFDPISIGILIFWLEKSIEGKIILLKMEKEYSRLENILRHLEALAYNKPHIEKYGYSVDYLSEYYGNDENNFTSNLKELLPLDLRGLPSFALAVAIDDDTFVPSEMFGNVKKNKVALALYNSQILRVLCEDLGFSWKDLIPLFAREGGIEEVKNRKILKQISKLFAVSEGYFLNEKELIQYGKRVFFRNQQIIEKVKKVKGSIDNIPSHFLNDRSSNYKKEQLVSVGGDLDDYYSLISHEKQKLNTSKSK